MFGFNKEDLNEDLLKIKRIEYTPLPLIRKRIIEAKDYGIVLDTKTNYTLAKDKEIYPSIFDNHFMIHITTNSFDFVFDIENRYRWNHADILGLIQIIAMCSKDDRRVILASGIHDYMLEMKQKVFKAVKTVYSDLTVPQYRKLTSNIFEYILVSQGMGTTHAKMMANVVDWFQKNFQKKKWVIDYDSMEM